MDFKNGFLDAGYIDDLLRTPEDLMVVDNRLKLAVRRYEEHQTFGILCPTIYNLGQKAYELVMKAADYAGKRLLGLGN